MTVSSLFVIHQYLAVEDASRTSQRTAKRGCFSENFHISWPKVIGRK